jgi:nucleotide-binding universal stress UspA family protein
MYEKVLLALDGSRLSDSAVPHALAVAKPLGAEMVLLQVVDSVGHIVSQYTPAGFEPGPDRVAVEVAEQAVGTQRSAAEQHMSEVKRQLEAEGIANVSIEIVEGSPGDMICGRAEELGCDLVVMATHGRSGLGRAVLGSVADYVVRHTPHAAVLLVRPQE